VKRGAEAKFREFEAAVGSSVAVVTRSLDDTWRLVNSDNEGYVPYRQPLDAGVRFPRESKWDALREVADAALFGPYREHVRFAALSLDGKALANYGAVAWVLRESMIADRTSVFEENSVLFMKHHKIRMEQAHKLPRGYRATWAQRSKLCVAKLGHRILATTPADEFSGILLHTGARTEDDEFVEVHIGGSLTIRTLDRVILMEGNRRERKTIAKALEAKLGAFGVKLEI
jgi:hypothetical protein